MATIVQQKVVSFASAGSNTIAFDNPTQAGNSIVFVGFFDNGSSATTQLSVPTDTQNLSFSRVAPDVVQSGGPGGATKHSAIICCLATGTEAAADTVTFNNPTSDTLVLVEIYEITGALSFDTSNSNFNGNPSANNFSTGTIAPATGYFEVALFGSVNFNGFGLPGVTLPWSQNGDESTTGGGFVGALAHATQSETACVFSGSNVLNNDTTAAIYAFTVAATYSISGQAGANGAAVSYSGPVSGSVIAASDGTYSIPGLSNGSYSVSVSLPGRTFSPSSQSVTISSANQTGINFTENPLGFSVIGFSPSFVSQNEGGLNIYVSPGIANGVKVNGQFVAVFANSTTYVWVDSTGQIWTGLEVPPSVYAIAQVVSGQIQVSGTGNPNSGAYVLADGIISITDIRST